MAVVEPPLHPLFGHPRHFEKLVSSVVARIPHGSVLMVARSSPTTWMDATLAGAVAARISGSVLAIGLTKDSSAANNEAATLASSAALIGEIPTASTSVEAGATSAFLCCAWVHAEVAPHLDALIRTYTQGPVHASAGTVSTSSRSSSSIAVQSAVRVVGLVSVRFEQSPATSFLEGLGPVIACSFSRDGGPPWQQSQPSPIPTLLYLPNHVSLNAPTTTPTGGNAGAAPGSGNRKRQRAPSPSAVLAEPAVDVATAIPGRLGGNELVGEARARPSASNVMLNTSEPEAVDEALTRGSEDAQMETSPNTTVPTEKLTPASGPAISMPGVENTIDLTEIVDMAEGVSEAPMMGGSEHLPEILSDSRSSSDSSRDSNNTSGLNTGSSSSGSGSSSLKNFAERTKGDASTNSDNNESIIFAAGVQEQLGSSPLGMYSFGYGANAPSEDRSSSLQVPGLGCCPPDAARRDHASNAPESSEDDTTTAHLYLVADGHGGGLAAQFVNDHLLVEAAQQLRQLPAYDDSAATAAVATSAEATAAAAAATGSGADTPGRLQAAVQAALAKAFAATEAAFLASLDATWACEKWQAVDDEDREQRRQRRSHSQLPPPSLLLLESALPAATSSSSGPESAGIAVGRVGSTVDLSTAASEATAVVKSNVNYTSDGRSSSHSNCADCTTSSTNSTAAKSSTNTNTSHGLAAGLCNAGSCAVLVCVLGGWLYSAHVGDCRAVLASLVPADTSNEMVTSSPVAALPAATAAAGETTGGAEEAPSTTAAGAGAARDSTAAPAAASEAAGNSSSRSGAAATPRRQRSSSLGSSSAGGGSKGRVAKRSRRSSSLSAGASSLPPQVVDALTLDQNCYREDEVERVSQLASSDPEPIRPSKNDQKALDARAKNLAQRQLAKDRAAQGLNHGDDGAATETAGGGATGKGRGNPKLSRGAVARGRGGAGGGKGAKGGKGRGTGSEPMLRVAGSLAVTRAFGDMYLKHRRYAPEDLRPHVPYLIAKPETSCRRLHPELDTMLVLASDGLWEVATPEQACGWAATHLANHGLSSSSTCTAPPSLPVPKEATATTVTTADASTGADSDGHEIAGQANSSAIPAVAATGTTEVGHQPRDAELQSWSANKRPLRGRTSDRSSRSTGHSSNNSSGQVNAAQEVVLQALSTCAAKARMSALELSRLPPGPERRKFHDDITVLVVMLPAAQRLVRNTGSDD